MPCGNTKSSKGYVQSAVNTLSCQKWKPTTSSHGMMAVKQTYDNLQMLYKHDNRTKSGK